MALFKDTEAFLLFNGQYRHSVIVDLPIMLNIRTIACICNLVATQDYLENRMDCQPQAVANCLIGALSTAALNKLSKSERTHLILYNLKFPKIGLL